MKNKPPFIDKHHGTGFVPLKHKHFPGDQYCVGKYKPMSIRVKSPGCKAILFQSQLTTFSYGKYQNKTSIHVFLSGLTGGM